MATKAELISDIELRLSRGKPSDDLELEQSQIAHWLDTVRDTIVSYKLAKDAKDGISIPPIYIKQESCLLSLDEGIVCNSGTGLRKHFTITNEILEIDNDRGLIRIVGDEGEWVNIYSADEAQVITKLRFSKPGINSNLTGYREGLKVFIMGLTDLGALQKKFNVFYIETSPSKNLSDSDEYPIESELLETLLEGAEDIGRRQMGTSEFKDLDNDGIQYEDDE